MKTIAAVALAAALVAQKPQVDVVFDTGEADAVLRIAALHRDGVAPQAADWQTLTSSRGYQRLKSRELSLGRSFDEDAFRNLVDSDELAMRVEQQRRTV